MGNGSSDGSAEPLARVLLIDDSPAFLRLVATELTQRGFEVVGAESGLEGLEVFYEAKFDQGAGFDIVLTDVSMPDVDGLSVLNSIRARSAEIPVIILTSAEDMPTVRQAMRDGAFDYVLKTEGIAPLVQAMERSIEHVNDLREKYRGVEDPMKMLQDLSAKGARGEFVVVAANLEVHVHLHDGRVAWATSSRVRMAFTRWLMERFDVDADVIQVIVDECRQNGRNVGETLVERGICTREQVRAALMRQMRTALSTLEATRDAQAVFLPRKANYSANLLFDLDEILAS